MRLSFDGMDEGLPIAYEVLEQGISVYSSDGETVGTVDHVVAAPEEDIFHGIVIRTASGTRFVAADDVASLHERCVDLRIDAAAIAGLPEPHGAAAARRVREPGVKPSRWRHLVDRLTGAAPGSRDWTDEN
jgi:sporulation protein YlmC with PRC-barrel domain